MSESLVSAFRTWCRTARGRRRLRQAARSQDPLRIVVGSGGIGPAGWVATDVEYLDLLRPNEWAAYFAPASIAAILAEHVWEHLSLEDGLIAAQTCQAFLRLGGYLRLAVPDGYHPDPAYIEQVKVGGTGAGAHDHKVLYTIDSLTGLLRQAGFAVEPLEYFDAARQFHAVPWNPADGLVRRSARFDARNKDGTLRYTSLIVDARKRAE